MGGTGTGLPIFVSTPGTLTSTDVLIYVNLMLKTKETNIDDALMIVLRDLAGMYVLIGEDTSQPTNSSTLYLNYPDDALDSEGAVITVVPSDAGQSYEPLTVFPGGWRDYRRLMEGSVVRGTPQYMIPFDRRIYLYPAPNGVYATSIFYYKRHPESVIPIWFSNDWINAILFGTVKEVAYSHKMMDQIALWTPRYEQEKDRQRITHNDYTHICGG